MNFQFTKRQRAKSQLKLTLIAILYFTSSVANGINVDNSYSVDINFGLLGYFLGLAIGYEIK